MFSGAGQFLANDHIYRLARTVLDPTEEVEIARHINAELENHPPRFAANVWRKSGFTTSDVG